ncbi:MAG: hypothetical protein U9R25_08085 [Chloroflexota bacterium]|nr:hypothetical protein [Chloroflexota bacterium]
MRVRFRWLKTLVVMAHLTTLLMATMPLSKLATDQAAAPPPMITEEECQDTHCG